MTISADKGISQETVAAIAAAIHLHLEGEVHDIESGVLTIRRPSGAWDERTPALRREPKFKF